jgi:hypothetical protein
MTDTLELVRAYHQAWTTKDYEIGDSADFKLPRAIHVVQQLPRSTLSKVNKVELRKVAALDADRSSAEGHWISEAALDPSGDAVEPGTVCVTGPLVPSLDLGLMPAQGTAISRSTIVSPDGPKRASRT